MIYQADIKNTYTKITPRLILYAAPPTFLYIKPAWSLFCLAFDGFFARCHSMSPQSNDTSNITVSKEITIVRNNPGRKSQFIFEPLKKLMRAITNNTRAFCLSLACDAASASLLCLISCFFYAFSIWVSEL